MYPLICCMLGLAPVSMHAATPRQTSASFVTTLGRDTIAVESYRLSKSRLDGDILLRAPRTVRYHYAADLRPDGTTARIVTELSIPGLDPSLQNRTTISFLHDSALVQVDTGGGSVRRTVAAPYGTAPEIMSGFNSDFGLYLSLGLYQLVLSNVHGAVGDTSRVPVIAAVGGQSGTKLLVSRSPTLIDVDYFRIAWTHFSLDSSGEIEGVDATATTEKTRSARTVFIKIDSASKAFLRHDREAGMLGVASPPANARATIGAASIAITYSSPRKRGREVLGTLVPYDAIWRTGANAATVMTLDHDVVIGGTRLAAGQYSLWTVPGRNGVELIINSAVGQWGTQYDPKTDLLRLPMKVEHSPSVLENFTIAVDVQGDVGQLRIAWDDFVWSVTISRP